MCDAHGGDGKALMKNLSIRLKAYKPNGDTLGLLPQPSSFSASFLHDDTGALRLEYSRKALNGSILERKLETGLEIAVEVSDGGKWLEPLNGRFVLISRSRDALDSSDTVTFTCPSYAWLLNKALMLDLAHLEGDGDDKGKRVFKKASAGLVMRTFLDENKTRGGIPVTCGFDTGRDSAGAAWKSVMTLAYTPGISSLTALANLAGNKICDWAFDKRTLKIWNMDSTALCRDLSRISVQLAHDVLEAPEEESIEALASHILVQGDNNKAFTRDNPAAPSPWGKWETYLSQQGISDDDTAALYMQSTLDTAARVRGQYTRVLRVNDAPSLPLIDYRPGDWITAPTVMHGEKVRVQQVTLSLESNQFKASVVLNDKVYDATVRQAKRVQGITGGAINGGTGGGLPAPEKDHRTPKAVTGLVVQTDAYISSRGTALGLATLQWAAVSQATDNTAIDISSYRVEYRKNLAGAPWVSGGVTDAQRLTLGIGGLECGQRYEFRVRAVPTYSDRLGDWSNVVVALVASDVTPPSIPSKPILTSKLGVVDVQWDGRNNAGGGMELDFDHVEVGISDSNGNWKYRDSVARDGHCVVTGLEYRAYWFALRSVDHSGNKSDWGVGASITVASAVSQTDLDRLDKDLRDNKTAIDNANRELSQAKQDIAGNTTAIGNANRELATAKSDLTQAKQDIANNTTAIGNANKQITSNKTAIDNANRGLDAAQGDIAQAKKDITQAKSDAANAKNEAGKASAAIESAKSDIANAASKAQSALDKANSVGKSLDGLHNVYEGPDDPTTISGVTVRQGDFWYKTQKYWTRWSGAANDSTSLLADFYTGWEGEPNNSASWLVPLSRHFIGVYVFDGSRWNERNIVAANILASGSVVASNLAANSITSDKIVAGAVIADKLAANSVTAGKIAANAVNAAALVAGAITTEKLAALAVTADKLAAKAVVAGKLAANAVTAETIAAGAIVAGKLAANSVAAGNIVSGAVTADKLAANSVNADKLAANSVTADKIKADAILARHMSADSVTTQALAALSVTVDKLAAKSVIADKIAAGAVIAEKIASGAITTDKLAALAVTADKLAANIINAGHLVSGAVTADKLAANSVDASKIVAQSVTGDRIASNTIVARNIAAQSITSDRIAAGQFAGYVFTGAIFQSSTADNTGWKLRGNALDMWDSRRNQTVHLDGEGGSNLLTGTFQTGLSGNRVMISPSFQQSEVTGSDKLEGAGIQFYHGTDACAHPYIAVESTTQQEGEVSALAFNGGHRAEHDPGAFGRIGERKDDAGRKFSVVYFDANRNYDESVAGNQAGARIFLEAHPEAGNTFASLEAYDVNGKVGVQADINQGYLYMSGFVGGFTGRATFGTAFWKAWWGGAGTGNYSTISMTYTPAKYGYYRWVVNPAATVSFATAHTGGDTASSTTIYGYGERGQDTYVSALAYLRK